MRIPLAIMVLATACSREAPPRDYQNNPPAMTHPVTSSSQSPSQQGLKGAAPEPSQGAEGKNITRKPTSPIPATLTLKDQPPVTDTQHATQTTSTAATGTHLAVPP
jgi:hypothetical protein